MTINLNCNVDSIVNSGSMKNILLISFLILVCTNTTTAQTTRDVEVKPSAPVYQVSKQKSKFSFAKLFSKKETDTRKLPYEQKEEFEARMRAVAKQIAKDARLASKPQYSKQEYFGHKRKPKKRPVGKKKYCKICEFAH